MDELLIDDRKYISSKQAAKITGYAKDYIGQLCREGRVPARLVGRSWYVLEAAIQDHRFGAPVINPKEDGLKEKTAPKLPWTQEPARYEALPIEPLPITNRKVEEEIHVPEPKEEEKEPHGTAESFQNAWKAWFDRVGDTITSVTSHKADPEPEIEPEPQAQMPIETEQTQQEEVIPEEIVTDNEVNIPIHTIYRTPPREILPHYDREEVVEKNTEINIGEDIPLPMTRRPHGYKKGTVKAIRITAFIIGAVVVATTLLNSGYLDKYLVSNKQVMKISGLDLYNK
jgi:hypothetical protein